jgi:hypothetical protein
MTVLLEIYRIERQLNLVRFALLDPEDMVQHKKGVRHGQA